MRRAPFDPGLTQQYGAPLRRALNKDGSFNVRRRGADWSAFHPWLAVVRMSWTGFAALVIGFYLSVNTLFALAYFSLNAGQITGSAAPTELRRFLNDFFFSAHTLTTVGYGNLAPAGLKANVFATLEALIGLLGFAVVTGMLVARASKPSASIGYSKNVLVAPYQEGKAVMLRIANQRSNDLMEMEAQVLLMTVGGSPDKPERKFELLPLERDRILIFALTWTIVHPIDEASPFYGKSAADLERMQAELIVLIKGFDDTFSQVVHSRQSYRHDEFVWGAKFDTAFTVEPAGDLMLELNRLGAYSLTEKAAVARISRDDDPARTSNSA
ncbi:MAG TPA: ion channel [Bryobacteraceae bacterium]|nr:ion channel [Bryobacteraceae bacterium]